MAGRIVVSNTTPLIALAWLNHLDLIPSLFGDFIFRKPFTMKFSIIQQLWALLT